MEENWDGKLESGPHKGKVNLGTRKIIKGGSNLMISIPRKDQEVYLLLPGEIVDVVLTRTGIIKPRQNRIGNPALRKAKN